MSKRNKKRKLSVPAQFKIDDRVRVRRGVVDVEHPDIPLGGWTGTIIAKKRGRNYEVRWTDETLASMPPIYKKRSTIENTVVEIYRLSEAELEPDLGEPLAIEQPTQIVPRPLSTRNRDDRIRAVFGLTSDDFLPPVEPETLTTYCNYLNANLSLPAEAWHFRLTDDDSPLRLRTVKVLSLERAPGFGTEAGIRCKVISTDGEKFVPLNGLRFSHSTSNRRLIDDFRDWMDFDVWNRAAAEWIDDEDDVGEDEDFDDDVEFPPEQATNSSVGKLALEVLALGVLVGTVVGAALAVMPWAIWTVSIAGGICSTVFGFANAQGQDDEISSAARILPRGGSTLSGLIVGGLLGIYFGALAAAPLGAILSVAAGCLLLSFIDSKKLPNFDILPRPTLIFAGLGATAQAFYHNGPAATDGMLFGIAIGFIGAVLLFATAAVFAFVVSRWQRHE